MGDDPPVFSPGRIVITRAANQVLTRDDVTLALARHIASDWGDVEPGDSRLNDAALFEGDRLVSVYRSRADTRFFVITEGDRSVTTVLLPVDY